MPLSDLTAPASAKGVAVVTGGTAGLGRATARALADAGWDVAVLARGVDGLEGTVADVASRGRRALGVVCDVAHHQQVDDAAAQVERELGPVEVWVNNAMASVFMRFLDVDPADYERANAVTYLGTVNGTRAALRSMVRRDRGVVVQVGSALAHRGIPLQAPYCGAKHAVVGFTESVITELLHAGSRVEVAMVHMPALNTPQFGWVRTDLPAHPQPVEPIFEPEVGAAAVVQTAEHPVRSTWVGLPTAYTTVGNRLVAPLLDRYLALTGVDGQQTEVPADEMLGDNLWEPVPGDHGARGRFSDQASDTSAYERVMALQRRARSASDGVTRAGLAVAAKALKAPAALLSR